MARIRHIKEGFFSNEQLADCSAFARLLFAGLWVIADREGRLEDRPRRIRAEILPYDTVDANDLLEELKTAGFIIRYMVDGGKYIQVVNFSKHQRPHPKEAVSTIPPPENYTAETLPETEEVVTDTETKTEETEKKLKETESREKKLKDNTQQAFNGDGDGFFNGNGKPTTATAREPADEIPDPAEHWAVLMFEEELGIKPHILGAQLIAAKVTNREVWLRVLGIWKGNRHAVEKIGNVVDRYENEIKKEAKQNAISTGNGNGSTRETASTRNGKRFIRNAELLAGRK